MERGVSAHVTLRCGVGVLAILVLATLFSGRPAWGRAGGGGGYSSSSSSASSSYSSSSYSSSSYSSSGYSSSGYSSSGYSSGSSGSNSGLPPGEFAAVMSGCVLVAVVLILPFYVRSAWRDVRQRMNAVKARNHARENWHRQVVNQIQRRDPAFDVNRFVDHFKVAFVHIQQAWMQQNMSSVMHFVTDGIYEKFMVQFAEQQRQGFREQLTQIRVSETRLAWFGASGPFEVLCVAVQASMVDQRVDLKSGRRLQGIATTQSFAEIWSFVRCRGTQTKADRSLLAGRCPNCGSPVELNQFGHCQACGSVLRSGAYDWVLSEITQACEWREGISDAVVEVARDYRQRYDSRFSAQQLEDRAAVILARKGLADLSGNLNALRKVASPEFCRVYQGLLEEQFIGDISVGSLDLLGILTERQSHYALLEVRWAGRVFVRSAAGALSSGKEWKRAQSVMVLRRAAGVTSNVSAALQSAHCPSCGAAEEDLTVDACPFCDAVANTGQYDWVLEAFVARESLAGRNWRGRLGKTGWTTESASGAPGGGELAQPDSPVYWAPQAISDSECLMWLTGVFADDGRLDAQERQVIAQLAAKNAIADRIVQQWFVEIQDGEFARPAMPGETRQQDWLDQLVGVCLADGALAPDERSVLQQLTRQLGMSRNQLRLLIAKRYVEPRREA